MKKAKTSDTLAPRQAMRGSMTMAVVLGSGLVLTLLSYILLYIFIGGIAQKRIDVQYRDIEERLQEKTDRLTGQMGLFGFLLKNSVDFHDIGTYLTQMAPSARRRSYDQVLWISSRPDIQIERILYNHEGNDPRLMMKLHGLVIEQLQAKKADQNRKIETIFLDSPQIIRTDSIEIGAKRYNIRYGYVAMIQSAIRPDGSTGYLVGLLPFKHIIYLDDIFQQGKGISLALDWGKDGRVLDIFSENLGSHQSSEYESRFPNPARIIPLFNKNVEFSVHIEQNYEQWFLSEIPYFIPVIGLVLTFFGALYVRNNQRQAVLLMRMNKMLALKNMEMNSQVTERERLNQILRKTEQEKRAIMDSVSDIIFEIDQDGKFQFLNETWYRITGFPVEQTKGIELFDMIEPVYRESQKKVFRQILTGENEATTFSLGILSVGDIYRQMQVRYSMIRTDEANNPRVVGTMTDIEEFKRAQTALAEVEEKYRTIWEHAVTGIYQATVEGQLISANPALARIFGYKTSEDMIDDVVMMNRQLYFSPKERQSAINTLLNQGKFSNLEFKGVRRGGEHFWFSESARIVRDNQGTILYLEGNIDDITERKKAEVELKTTMTELELANRSKTEFLANMSHELRTPLNAIIGFSEIIKDEVFGRLEQKQYRDYARDIYDSGKRLLGIINTILDVSRIEAGQRQLNETAIDVPRVAYEAGEMVRARIEENSQILKFDIQENLPKFWGEELAIKQILLNLLTNAVKFTPTGGHITVSAKIDTAGDLRLMIVDTGIGLNEEEVERVMAPFGQASGSFDRSSSGPGLGLTLVNSLIRLHGGHFEMISQKGVGTTATAILPASRLQR